MGQLGAIEGNWGQKRQKSPLLPLSKRGTERGIVKWIARGNWGQE